MRYHRYYRLRRPPAVLRKVKLDNLAVVPASMLPFKHQWQQLANGLPEGSTLIILPTAMKRHRQPFERVARQLRKEGKQVTTVSTEQFTHR